MSKPALALLRSTRGGRWFAMNLDGSRDNCDYLAGGELVDDTPEYWATRAEAKAAVEAAGYAVDLYRSHRDVVVLTARQCDRLRSTLAEAFDQTGDAELMELLELLQRAASVEVVL